MWDQVCSWKSLEDSLHREPPRLLTWQLCPVRWFLVWNQYQFNYRLNWSDIEDEMHSFNFPFNVNCNWRLLCFGKLCLEYLETHSKKTVLKANVGKILLTFFNRSYMEKYTYHHYHPKLNSELFSERDNTSIHFYSRNKGARITKSSHFRYTDYHDC